MKRTTLARANYLVGEIETFSKVKAVSSDETRTIYISDECGDWIELNPEMSGKVLVFINQLYRERLIDLEAELLNLKCDE